MENLISIPVTNTKGFVCECGSTKFNLVLDFEVEQGKTKLECQKCGKHTLINMEKRV